MTPHDAAVLSEAALVGRDDRGNTVIHIAGHLVEVRVKEDGRLRIWIELDEDKDVSDRPTVVWDSPENGHLLPAEIGIYESVVFETDPAGHEVPA